MMSEKDMENLNETEKFDDDLISTETLHDIRDVNQTHPKINKREARLAIRDHILKKIAMERSVKSYAQNGESFTQIFQYYCIGDFTGTDQFRRNWFRSVPFHTRT